MTTRRSVGGEPSTVVPTCRGLYACRALLAAGLLAKPNAQGPLLRYVAPDTTTHVEVPAEPGALIFEQQVAADVAQLDAELEALEALEEQLDDETDETVLRRKARQLEGLLRDRYASHRGIRRNDVEYAVLSSWIDVLDRARRRVVEAKLDAGLTSVCQAVGQAEGYLFALQRFEGVAVDRVAVLLPKRPGPFVLEPLGALVSAGRPVGLVYLDGDRAACTDFRWRERLGRRAFHVRRTRHGMLSACRCTQEAAPGRGRL